ncbi:hypothetical protein [Legionella erythra]|uniref:Ankyrin repeats (3 copies) n=1 Tax=Legionella erythra TaxID=448 RepID=A0A0W0TQP6_LEGER|nr:hypothetical protein [Legionella erythra]KTC97806.1 hypothetical protein Lery_1645 [Legionella erythra]
MAVNIDSERLIRASGNGLINTVQSLCDRLKLIHMPEGLLDQAILSALQGIALFKDRKPDKVEHCWQIIDRLCHIQCNDQVSEQCLDTVLLAAVVSERLELIKSLSHLGPPHHFPSTGAIHAALQNVFHSSSSHQWDLMVSLCRMGVNEDMRTRVFTALAKASQWQAIDRLYAAGLRPHQIGVNFILHQAAKHSQWNIFEQIGALQEPGWPAAGEFLRMAVRARQHSVVFQLCQLNMSNAIDPETILDAMLIAKNTNQPAIACYLRVHFIACRIPRALTAIFYLLKDYIPPDTHLTPFFKTRPEAIHHLKDLAESIVRSPSEDEEESQLIRDIIFSLKSSPLYSHDLHFIAMVNYIVEHYTDEYYTCNPHRYPLQ